MRKTVFTLLIAFAFIFSLNWVLAASCCEITNDNTFCASDIAASECSSGFTSGVSCPDISVCQRGCCFDSDAGVFSRNVLRRSCPSSQSWDSDLFCNLPGAEPGCCNLGDFSKYETFGLCRTDTEVYALGNSGSIDWRNDMTESECIISSATQQYGACIFSADVCTMTTESQCIQSPGYISFSPDTLCTAPVLSTSCEPTIQTTCVGGKDQVYFIDSCGNTANIYDANRVDDTSYWTNTIDVDDSCNGNNPSASSNSETCGNCYRTNNYCESIVDTKINPEYGDNYCKPLECIEDGVTYKNGESWCAYEGTIGRGRDLVGAVHIRHYCDQGVIGNESCRDYRADVCTQANTLNPDGSTSFRESECVENKWYECFDLSVAECQNSTFNPFCFVKQVTLDYVNPDTSIFSSPSTLLSISGYDDDDLIIGALTSNPDVVNDAMYNTYNYKLSPGAQGFGYEQCVPRYPKGFQFVGTDSDTREAQVNYCSLGTNRCTITYEKGWDMKYECVHNCECEGSNNLVDQMNDFCTSLGDCGLYANVEGVVTNGGSAVSRTTSGPMTVSAVVIQAYESLIVPSGPQLALIIMTDLPLVTIGATNAPDIYRGSGTIFAQDKWNWDSGWGEVVADIIDPARWIGVGKTKTKVVSFTCKPWQQPVGADDCEKCSDYEEGCTDYKCQSLGAACEMINVGQEDEMCTSADDDGVYPAVSLGLIPSGYDDVEYIVTSTGLEIGSTFADCHSPYSFVPLSVNTDEPAVCKYSDDQTLSFADMKDIGSTFYVYNHQEELWLTDPSGGVSRGLNITGDVELYVKCQDRFGHETPDAYTVDLCVNEGDDEQAPRVRRSIPKSDSYLPYNTSLTNITLITNELSTCRWSQNEHDEYSEMPNEFSCDSIISNPSSTEGYVCKGEVPINSSTNEFYIKCADQPWFIDTIDEPKRNAMSQSYGDGYTLNRPEQKITITGFKPETNIVVPTPLVTVLIEVRTANGVPYHNCEWSQTGYNDAYPFYQTGGAIHTQKLEYEPGRHTLFVECSDETGDSTREEINLEVIQETTPPRVTRTWQSGTKINIVTDEEAVCKYSTQKCSFLWDDGDKLAGNDIEHRFDAIKGREYYIRCQDMLGNAPTGCSITIAAS